MKWIEDPAIREWTCKQSGNIFSATIRWQWCSETYQARIYIGIFNSNSKLAIEKNFETLKSAQAFAEKTLRDISKQAISLAGSHNKKNQDVRGRGND